MVYFCFFFGFDLIVRQCLNQCCIVSGAEQSNDYQEGKRMRSRKLLSLVIQHTPHLISTNCFQTKTQTVLTGFNEHCYREREWR